MKIATLTCFLWLVVFVMGCVSQQEQEQEPVMLRRMIFADWWGREIGYARRPYRPYYEFWEKHGFEFNVTGADDIFVLQKSRDFMLAHFNFVALYPVQIMTPTEFVRNGGGICKDWAMFLCYSVLWKRGYDARFVVGTNGPEHVSNLHAWVIVYIRDEVWILDRKVVTRIFDRGFLIQTSYHPWLSFQGKKVWLHKNEADLKLVWRRMKIEKSYLLKNGVKGRNIFNSDF